MVVYEVYFDNSLSSLTGNNNDRPSFKVDLQRNVGNLSENSRSSVLLTRRIQFVFKCLIIIYNFYSLSTLTDFGNVLQNFRGTEITWKIVLEYATM